jgi:hypothetical protein
MTITLNGTTGITTPALDSVAQFSSADMPAGSVLQVVSTSTVTSTPTTSTSFVTTALNASIIPTSATSKIFIIIAGGVLRTGSTNQGYLTVYRGGTNLGDVNRGLYQVYSAGGSADFPISMSYYDTPTTTLSTTYSVYVRTSSSTTTFEVDAATCTLTLMEIAA